MIGADEWKGEVAGPPSRRATPSAPSASVPKWTVEETECIQLAYETSKLVPSRFHAEFNDITPGRQRTLAELRLHLPRVATSRGFEVPATFLADCDAVIDGLLVEAIQRPPAAVGEAAWLRSVPTKDGRWWMIPIDPRREQWRYELLDLDWCFRPGKGWDLAFFIAPTGEFDSGFRWLDEEFKDGDAWWAEATPPPFDGC